MARAQVRSTQPCDRGSPSPTLPYPCGVADMDDDISLDAADEEEDEDAVAEDTARVFVFRCVALGVMEA